MDKNARSRSSDSKQEKLRESKDEWNSEVSEVIYDLIALKRGMNGRGDKNYNIPSSSIKEPLPSAVGETLSETVNHFQNMVNGARAIITQQNEYSQIRKKPLHTEASWVGSRLLSRLSLLGKKDRSIKIRLINGLADIEDLLKNFETLMGGANANLASSFEDFVNIITKLDSIIYKNLLELKKIHTGEDVKISPFTSEEIEQEELNQAKKNKFEFDLDNYLKKEEVKKHLNENEELPSFEFSGNDQYKIISADSESRKILFKFLTDKNKIPQDLLKKTNNYNSLMDSLEDELENLIKDNKEDSNIFKQKLEKLNKTRNNLLEIYGLIFNDNKDTFKDYIPFLKEASSLKRLWQKIVLNINSSSEDIWKLDIIKLSEKIRSNLDNLSNVLETRTSDWSSVALAAKPCFTSSADLIAEILIWLKNYQKEEASKNFSTSTEVIGPIAKRDQRPIIENRFKEALTTIYKTLNKRSTEL